MIKKLHIRFIILAMISLTVLLSLIVAGMNIANYRNVVCDADERIEVLEENSGRLFGGPSGMMESGNNNNNMNNHPLLQKSFIREMTSPSNRQNQLNKKIIKTNNINSYNSSANSNKYSASNNKAPKKENPTKNNNMNNSTNNAKK